MSWGRLIAILVSLLVGTACAAPVASPSPSGQATASPSTATPPTPSPSSFPRDDEFALMITAAAGAPDPAGSDLDEFWRWVLDTDLAGALADYASPAAVVPYRQHTVPDSGCAVGRPARMWVENARYCGLDRTIYFDEDWLRDFGRVVGNFAPAAILAHEWGHHVQFLIGTPLAGDVFSIQIELQADCFAGMFVGAREKIVNGEWTLGVDDLDDAAEAFFLGGNKRYDASAWMGSNEHGSALQRLLAFSTGYMGAIGEGGPFGAASNFGPCAGYDEFEPRTFADVGPYRLVVPPGRTVSGSGALVTIDPLAEPATVSSTIELAWLEGAIALDDVAGASDRTFPDMQVLIGPSALEPLPTSLGDIVYFYFGVDEAGGQRSGFYGVLPPTETGTLAIRVSRNEPPVEGMSDPRVATLTEQLAAFAQVAGRLCLSGQSGVPGEGQFNAACSSDQ